MSKFDLKIEEAEVNVLTMHLYEFLGGSAGRSRTLVTKKFELIETLLFASFGFKSSTLVGFQRKDPYFSDKHIKVIEELKEIDSVLTKMSFNNHFLNQTYLYLSEIVKLNAESQYVSISDLTKEMWEEIERKYNKLGVNKNKEQLSGIINDLKRKYS